MENLLHLCFSRQALLTVSGGGSRLSSSSGGPGSPDKRRSSNSINDYLDDDDKLLDVVGPDTPHPAHHHHHRSRSRDRDGHNDRGATDGSESSGSESGHLGLAGHHGEGPRPDISVGPPLHPPLLPYLYPPVPGLYPGSGHLMPPNPLAGLHGGVSTSMILNAQLALAAQHSLFAHYPHPLASPLHQLKGHRFAPYSLPSHAASHGSAFETVTPGSRGATLSPRSPPPSAGSPAPSREPASGELKSIENMVNGLQDKRSSRRSSPGSQADAGSP